ncbi:hypothetical protein AGDE_14288 [Angomonas deanei]|uniref:Uncharacterized protein n=1 Tax=Angomonas deanei TaxID=59799 RepID=A0A7G2CMA5_9TRYP|nr:hypothetical protein AGDE_14288 [Angomonas deanei]CAD2219683.1 hypothetical protein, conserved [Angomonas deanei]|eukprot:EPY21092.1 hypothetical protein AGDE_14288 [Angomonas deanei]
MTATPVHVGNILFGEFLEFDPAGWTPAQLPQQNFSVVGITPSSGTEFTIYGVFNTSATYAVQFYNVQDGMVSGSPGLPTCSSLKISADGTTLSCTAEIKIGMIGMYGFLVRDSDTHWYLNGSTSLSPIAIIPPSPTATGVYSNGELTLTGTNLQTRNKADTFFIEIQIGFGDSGITCVTKSTDYEKGTASCTLNLGNKASKGAYPVFVINYLCNHPMKAPPVLVGGISIKENSAVSWIDVSVPVYLNNYSAIVPTTVRDGEKLHFIGNFSESLQYTVELGENAPTCADAKLISQNILQCTYKGKVGYTSSIEPLVRESSSQAYVSYNTTTISLTSLTVYPPLAVVKAVKGDCVTDAAQCKTGSRLTFTISNAVPAVANNRFLFSPEGPTCTVLSVNGETVECELTVPSGAASSSHAITFQTMANNNAWVEPAVSVGNLVLGVTGGGIQSAVDGMTATTTKEVEKVVTQQNNAAIGAAVAFAILFAIAVVIIICLFVCCSVKRKNKQRNLDFVESNYTAYNTEMSPQPRVD